MRKRFEVYYKVEDGYMGGERLQYTRVAESEIDDDMTEPELRKIYQDAVQEDFEQKIHPYGTNEDAFVEWAQGVIKAREE